MNKYQLILSSPESNTRCICFTGRADTARDFARLCGANAKIQLWLKSGWNSPEIVGVI